MNISGALIDVVDKDNKSLNNIITGNETWCFVTILKENSTLLNENHYCHLKARNFESIWVTGRLCWISTLPRTLSVIICICKTVNKEMYIDILHHLKDVVRRKLPDKWRMNSGFLFTTVPQHTLDLWSRIS